MAAAASVNVGQRSGEPGHRHGDRSGSGDSESSITSMAAADTASAARRALRRQAQRQQHGEVVSMAARATVGQHSGELGHSVTASVAVAGTARAARRSVRCVLRSECAGRRHARCAALAVPAAAMLVMLLSLSPLPLRSP
ncbi:hypothetical protein PF003_g13660 [Phytophthora fragariae]|nr:hypothetical protein PF003_g13660 [Phytophthora fragariae]